MKTKMRACQLADLKASLERRVRYPSNNIVVAKHLAKLDEARDYDAGSSYNYLYGELMAIKHAVSRGQAVTIHTMPARKLESVDQFMDWALTRYPLFREAGYCDLHLDPVELVWGGDSWPLEYGTKWLSRSAFGT